jgi:hypothetical protein
MEEGPRKELELGQANGQEQEQKRHQEPGQKCHQGFPKQPALMP